MAQVTIELRNLLKTNFELFDFDYEFDDKNFASELEQAVIDHYWNYEIGQETPDDFKRVFKRRWLQAMSYYNDLHNTTLLKYNPLTNYAISEVMEQLKDSMSKEDNTTQSNTNNKRIDDLKTIRNESDTISDYPQQDISQGDFLSGQRLSDSDIKNTGTVEDSGSSIGTGSTIIENQDNSQYEKTIEGLIEYPKQFF